VHLLLRVVSAVKETELALTPAEINPANDLTGPEKVDLAIISSSEISSIVSACLLGQSIEQVNNPSYSTKYIRLV
jgi:hypothetical protein